MAFFNAKNSNIKKYLFESKVVCYSLIYYNLDFFWFKFVGARVFSVKKKQIRVIPACYRFKFCCSILRPTRYEKCSFI